MRFSPTSPAAKTARVSITATLGGAATATLQGVGINPGALAITPPNRNLGSVLQGAQSGPTMFTVTNSGSTPSGVLITSVLGSAEFGIATDACAGKSLAPGATCSIAVVFAPTGTGQKSATLTAQATPGGLASAALTGVALAPASLSVKPATAAYSNTVVGGTSAAQSFTITNVGGVAAGATTALATVVSGTNAADFAITANTCTGTLAAAATCTVTVAFKPSALGSRSGTVTLSATPGGSAAVALTGTGLSAASLTLAAASGSSVDFGTVVLGSSAPGTFVVTNPGQQSTTALTVGITGAGFVISAPAAGDCVSTTTVLDPGESCTIHVRLTPTVAGAAIGNLTVNSTTGGSAALALRGTAVTAGTLTVAPRTQSFPALLPNARSAAVTFTVTNTGGAATGALTASITGSTEFAMTTNTCTGALAPAGNCAIGVVFAPVSAGQKTGALSIIASPGGTASADLSGLGQLQAALTIAPRTATFADTVAGATSAAQDFTVTNGGDVAAGTSTAMAAVISGTNGGDFGISANTCAATLAAKATCRVSVVFRPSSTSTGARSGTLTVSATPGAAPTATLSGNALALASLSIAPASGSVIHFGPILRGTSQNQTFVVRNGGQQRSGPVRIALTGTDFALISATGADCVSNTTQLDPGTTCTIRVSFTPTAATTRTATLMTTATPGTAATLALDGVGQDPSALTLAPSLQAFGSIPVGAASAPISFTITNTGDVAAGALTTAISGEFAIVTDRCAGVMLGADGSCTITVTFNPVSPALSKMGTLTVRGTPGGTVTSSLSGRGLSPAALRITPAIAPFTAPIGMSVSQTLIVTNGGESPSGNVSVTRLPSTANEFSVNSNTCTGTVAAGSSCSIVVTFRPVAAGIRSATLNVAATPGGAVSASLSATGTCVELSTTGCDPGFKCVNSACVPATVPCGTVPDCRVGNGGQCCVTSGPTFGSTVFTCQPPGAICATVSVIPCNSRAECPSDQVCCAHFGGGTVGTWFVACEDPVTGCVGHSTLAASQVCDANLTAFGVNECLVGTCHPDVILDTNLTIPLCF